jgi:hypothetical protein
MTSLLDTTVTVGEEQNYLNSKLVVSLKVPDSA